MDELTEAEREALREIVGVGTTYESRTIAVVARIKADAHAAGVAEGRALRQRIEALAAGWESWGGHASQECAAMLRAALAGTSGDSDEPDTHGGDD